MVPDRVDDPTITPGWALAEGPPVVDLTERFHERLALARNMERELPRGSRHHVYLNVGGIFTEHYPAYLAENTKRMRELGLLIGPPAIDTEEGVDENARRIRDSVLSIGSEGRKVVLNGHSKGCVDVSNAVASYPEIHPFLAAVLLLQGPYGGAPLANDLSTSPRASGLMEKLLGSLLHGNPGAMRDCSYAARKEFVRAHPYPTQVPTLCLATRCLDPDSPAALTAAWTYARHGVKTDGLVAQEDAQIPGTGVVLLDDLDHASACLLWLPGKRHYHAGDLQQALLGVVLEL